MGYPIFKHTCLLINFKFIFKFLFVVALRLYFYNNIRCANKAFIINLCRVTYDTNIRLNNRCNIFIIYPYALLIFLQMEQKIPHKVCPLNGYIVNRILLSIFADAQSQVRGSFYKFFLLLIPAARQMSISDYRHTCTSLLSQGRNNL